MAASGDNIHDLERVYEQQTSANAAADLDLLDRAIFHVNQGGARMSGHKLLAEHQQVRAILISRAWNTLWLARKALSMGYMPQALVLGRSAFEDWATAAYIRRNPDQAPRYLEVPQPPAARGQAPTFGEIFRDLAADYGDEPRVVYEELSLFAHPRAVGLQYAFTQGEAGFHFHSGPPTDWDRANFELGLHYLLQIPQILFTPVGALWEELAGSLDLPWLEQAAHLSDEIKTRLQAQDTTWKNAKQQPQQHGA